MVAKNVWIFVRGFWVRWGSEAWCPGDMITREGIPENGYIPVKGLNIHSLFCGRTRRRRTRRTTTATTTTTTTTASNLHNYSMGNNLSFPGNNFHQETVEMYWVWIWGPVHTCSNRPERLLATTGGNGSILVYPDLDVPKLTSYSQKNCLSQNFNG